jgi:hypothetical protein
MVSLSGGGAQAIKEIQPGTLVPPHMLIICVCVATQSF